MFRAKLTKLDVGVFPISRDPPEGGTRWENGSPLPAAAFPISRDPPEGGTSEE